MLNIAQHGISAVYENTLLKIKHNQKLQKNENLCITSCHCQNILSHTMTSALNQYCQLQNWLKLCMSTFRTSSYIMLKTALNDATTHNLTLTDSLDMAQNRPLWRQHDATSHNVTLTDSLDMAQNRRQCYLLCTLVV